MTEPEVLESGPTGPNRRPAVVVLAVSAVIVAVLAVWGAQSRPEPVPSPPTPTAPAVPARTPHPLGAGPIFIQTAVPGPRDPANRIFELYRNDYLLDSGSFVFDATDLSFTFQGARGHFEIEGSHLVIHEPVRYLTWTWQKGTDDYAGYSGSGTAEFIAPNLERYGVLGRL